MIGQCIGLFILIPLKPNHYLFSITPSNSLFINDVQISEVVSHKHLRVDLYQRCDWQNHIDFIKEKAWSRINLIRIIKLTIKRNISKLSTLVILVLSHATQLVKNNKLYKEL